MSGDVWFSAEADGSDGTGPSLAALLKYYASVLDDAPDNKRYEFDIEILERGIDD